jgi:general secretion pathway protein I
MRGRRRPEGGFTLLEVIVAITLFAVGIVLVFQLFSGALRLSAEARTASEATIYARQRMEEALLAPNPVEGTERGTFDGGYLWEVATAFVPQEEPKPYDVIRLRVTVRRAGGEDGRAVDLLATRWRWRGKNEGA